MKILLTISLICLSLANLPAQTSSPSPAPIQVMVLGAYHLGNPGQDLHNVKVDSVLTPEKQTELAEVADRLARFNPTKIAVEAVSEAQDFAYRKFENFTPEMLTKNPDERVQIGFRLAQQLKQKTVFGIDEQSETIDYFPFDKVEAYAKAHDKTAILDRMNGRMSKLQEEMETAQKTTPIRLMLANSNQPAGILSQHRDFYYNLLELGKQSDLPGAELNAAWYQRNAKIFGKLTQIAQPGDRVLVIFGAGHAFWLRHFVENTPGFQLVEVLDYLK